MCAYAYVVIFEFKYVKKLERSMKLCCYSSAVVVIFMRLSAQAYNYICIASKKHGSLFLYFLFIFALLLIILWLITDKVKLSFYILDVVILCKHICRFL